MKGRFVLLLSLLCVAQALPLSLDGKDPSQLTRGKRHTHKHADSGIADKEVRTIISAIVDAILDGDKKKRSEIPEDGTEDDVGYKTKTFEEALNEETNSGSGSGHVSSGSGASSSQLDQRSNVNKDVTGEDVDSKMEIEFGAESGSESGSDSGSGIGKRSYISRQKEDNDGESENGDAESDNVNERSENSDAESGDSNVESGDSNVESGDNNVESGDNNVESGSSSDNSGSGSGSNGEDDDQVQDDVVADVITRPPKGAVVTVSNDVGRAKRDEEGTDVQDKLGKRSNEKTENDLSKNKTLNITSNGAEESGNESGEESGEESGNNDTEERSSISSMYSNSVEKRDRILKESEVYIEADETNSEPDTSDKGESESGSASGNESDSELGSASESGSTESGDSSEVKRSVVESDNSDDSLFITKDTDTETDLKSESGSGSESGASSDESSGYGFGSADFTDKKSDIFQTASLNNYTKGTDTDEDVDESGSASGSAEVSSGDEERYAQNRPHKYKAIGVVDLNKNNVQNQSENKNQSAIINKQNENESNSEDESENESNGSASDNSSGYYSGSESGSGSSSGSGSTEEPKKKRHQIIQKIVTDMAKAAVDSVEADESDSVVRKSHINVPELNFKLFESNINIPESNSNQLNNIKIESIVQKSNIPTSKVVYKKEQSSIKKNNTDSLIKKELVQEETDETLKRLVKSILKGDPSVKSKIEELTKKREEDEEKLERDVLDLIQSASNEPEDETKEHVITEIKDFEGLVQSLSQMDTLSPYKHDMIAKKLEKDLLNHLSVGEKDGSMILQEEDQLLKDSEMEYVKAKIDEAHESTEEYALKHAGNLEDIRKHAMVSLRPIIESLPLRKEDIEGLAKTISKSAWVSMVTHTQKQPSTTERVRRNLNELINLS